MKTIVLLGKNHSDQSYLFNFTRIYVFCQCQKLLSVILNVSSLQIYKISNINQSISSSIIWRVN
jgi:hypothetical protein